MPRVTHTPQLVLVKPLSEMSREEQEGHMQLIRSRRMVAALEYAAGKNLKLGRSADKVKHKLDHQYDLLGKEIDRLDIAADKVDKRMIEIETLKQELGLIVDTMSPIPTEEEDDA
jgi:hypothetical protein